MMVYCFGKKQDFSIQSIGNVRLVPEGRGFTTKIDGSGILTVIEVSQSGRHYCRKFAVRQGYLDYWILKPPPSGWLKCPICHPHSLVAAKS